MARKLKKEKIDIFFLQETKCKSETLDKLGKKIWKGNNVIAVDSTRMAGGLAILSHPE